MSYSELAQAGRLAGNSLWDLGFRPRPGATQRIASTLAGGPGVATALLAADDAAAVRRTGREVHLKAIGLGLAAGAAFPLPEQGWTIAHLRPSPGYDAAIAASSPNAGIRVGWLTEEPRRSPA